MASYWIDTLVLKTEGNTYASLLHHPFLFGEKPTQCSRGSKKDFWRRCRGGSRKTSQDLTPDNESLVASLQVKTYQVPITNPYLPHYIICHLPLVFLSPTSPLPFYSPSLFRLPLFRLLVVMASPLSSPLSPDNEVLNFKQREGENLKDAWYRICNAQNRSTRKQSTSVLLRNFYIGATPWYRYILEPLPEGISWVATLLTLIML